MFFEFVGLSSFYVTIYNEEGEDLFNKLTDKLMLRTLLKGLLLLFIMIVFVHMFYFSHVSVLCSFLGIEETEKLDGLNYGTAGHCNAGSIDIKTKPFFLL